MQKHRRRKNIIILIIISTVIVTAIVFIIMKTVSVLSADEEKIEVFDPFWGRFSEISLIKQNGEIMMPFINIFESFGNVVTWNGESETARASNPKNDFMVSAKAGEDKAVLNGLEIALSAPAQIVDDILYMPFDFIKQIPGVVISEDKNKNLKIWSSDAFIKRHGWTLLSDGLIAHAGGGLYKDENGEQIPQIYTNSREALENSYANGHKVFEIDLLLTSDGKLAAVHDWRNVGGIKSSEEWKNYKIEGMYDALFIEDIYEFMLEHPDTFLVTDTKLFFDDDAANKKHLELLVNTAKEMDKSLLKQIIPQVYDQSDYSILMGVYPFESVIYTLYESSDTPEEVAEFVAGCDNIKAVAMMWTQLTDDFYIDLIGLSKYVYFFTINVPKQAEIFRLWGAHGFYTDYMDPARSPENVNMFIKLLRKIYIMFSPSSLIQVFVLLYIFNVIFIQGFILCLILAFLFKFKRKSIK